MPIGPGKYDDICTEVREKTNAKATIVIIVGGDKGEGFSCQGDYATILTLPNALEFIAKQIRKDGI